MKRSGVYPYLSTNIPSRFTRFSYLPDEEKYHDKSRPIYPFYIIKNYHNDSLILSIMKIYMNLFD